MASRQSERIVVAMSGGVDSSVAAAILKRKGHDVIGVTFKTWPQEECGAVSGRACCSLEAIARARAVAEGLKIPYYVIDFSKEFRAEVIDYFCAEYLEGRTPNPCVMCNGKIKFGLLLDKARELGAAKVATGHFAASGYDTRRGRYLLKEGKDAAKDQTYFLFNLTQDQLAAAVFPLSGYTKSAVRALAKRYRLTTFDTVSSQDICFIRDESYADYIRKKTGAEVRRGDIVDDAGKIVGEHKGIPFYTIGQRRGIGVAHKVPLYVTGIDIAANRVIVGPKRDLMKRSLIAHRLNWIAIRALDEPLRVTARIRYNHGKAAALVTPVGADTIRVEFDEPQSAPTPGQAVVFYDKRVVVGGGWIRESN